MFRVLVLLLVYTICMSNSCTKQTADCHSHIPIQNKTSASVYVSFSLSYPDTSLPNPNPYLSDYYKINPGETASPVSLRDCFEVAFKTRIPSGVLQIFVYDESTLRSTSWDTVKRNYLILKRYDLTLQDLKNSNFTLTYP